MKAGVLMGIRESLNLSQDAVLGMPVITIIGCREVHIENFRTILEYSDTFVKMRTKKGCVSVSGKRLTIEYYNEEEIHITGFIESVIP